MPAQALGAALLGLVLVVVAVRSVRVVPPGFVYVVERLGRYDRTIKPGWRFLLPFADLVRSRVDVRPTLHRVAPEQLSTQDGYDVWAELVLRFTIVDPYLITYYKGHVFADIVDLMHTQLRAAVGRLEREAAVFGRAGIGEQIAEAVQQTAAAGGVVVTAVEVGAVQAQAPTSHPVGAGQSTAVTSE